MNDLVLVQDDRVVADSRYIAEPFGKQHKNVLQAIDRLIRLDTDHRLNFQPMVYEYAAGDGGMKKARYFLMDRDAFSILVMSFNGAEAFEWKLKFLAAFNAMERQLRGETLSLERQKDMVLTIREAFGEDDARKVARSYGWPVSAPKRLPRPSVIRSQEDAILERLAKAAMPLAQKNPKGFIGTEICLAAGVLDIAVSPGMWERFNTYALGAGLLRGPRGWRIAQPGMTGAAHVFSGRDGYEGV